MSLVHRTLPQHAAVDASGWVPLDDEWEVTALPLVDISVAPINIDGNLYPVFARMYYGDALVVAEREGAELIHRDHVELLHQLAAQGLALEVAAFTGTPIAETTLPHSIRHDEACWRAILKAGWSGLVAVANVGKHWVAGASKGRAWLMGWWVTQLAAYSPPKGKPGHRSGPGFVQPRPADGSKGAHGAFDQHDDGTTTMLVRRRNRATMTPKKEVPPVRHTIREGSVGADVAAWQKIVGAKIDARFGPATKGLTLAWQASHGLVADGIVGQRSWEAAGEKWERSGAEPSFSVVSKASRAIIRDANAAWPNRKKQSDGTLGDARHQASKSDHNTGDAVDVTHDPASGCDGQKLARMAMDDPRTQYIIWNRKIWNVDRKGEGWRDYTGTNPHTHHVHISLKKTPAMRDDDSPWPWSPSYVDPNDVTDDNDCG